MLKGNHENSNEKYKTRSVETNYKNRKSNRTHKKDRESFRILEDNGENCIQLMNDWSRHVVSMMSHYPTESVHA